MKTTLIALAVGLALAAGAQPRDKDQQQRNAAKAAAKKPSVPPKNEATAVPKDAVEIEPGVYRWKDAQGKSWILRRSPFGLLKGEEPSKSEPVGEEDDASLAIKVFEEGDELRFERRTPFGVSRWTKKRTELDELEQRAWDREQKRRAADRPKE